MTTYHQAMYRFWSQFTHNGQPVAAYLKGRVPDEAQFPYITYECPMGSFGGKNVITAYNWHHEQSGVNVMAERAALLDQIARAIPAREGTMIEWDSGFAKLYRNDNNFQSYYDVEDAQNPDALPVLGGMTSYEIHFYNA